MGPKAWSAFQIKKKKIKSFLFCDPMLINNRSNDKSFIGHNISSCIVIFISFLAIQTKILVTTVGQKLIKVIGFNYFFLAGLDNWIRNATLLKKNKMRLFKKKNIHK